MNKTTVTAGVLIIGNEILSGRTQDANLAHIASSLNGIGIRLMEARVVRDTHAEIIKAVNEMRHQYNYLFTTGGIGPTHDDITSEAVAQAFGVPIVRNPRAVALLESYFGAAKLNAARLKMAEVPDGATLLDNSVSLAPGFRMGNVFVLAGVPTIMRAMLEGLRGALEGGLAIESRVVTVALGEGLIAADLAATQERFPHIEIGSYPYFTDGTYGTSLVLRGTDLEQLDLATQTIIEMVESHGAVPIVEEA